MCEEVAMIHQQSGKWSWAVLTWEGEDFSNGRSPRPFPIPDVFGYEILCLTHPTFPPGLAVQAKKNSCQLFVEG